MNIDFEQNKSNTRGGGIGLYYFSDLYVRDCLIRNNVAQRGGGIGFYTDATVRNAIISDCTIVSNYATISGGGIYNDYDNVTSRFENCIIYFNKSADGIFSNYYLTDTASASFSNCNFSPALTSSVPVSRSTNNITSDPQLENMTGGNCRLRSSSPCINAGINRSWMTGGVDLDGNPRIRYGTVDMGAYERIYEGTIYVFH